MAQIISNLTSVFPKIAGDFFFHYRTGNLPLKTYQSGLSGIHYRKNKLRFHIFSWKSFLPCEKEPDLFPLFPFGWISTGRVWEFHLLYLGASEEWQQLEKDCDLPEWKQWIIKSLGRISRRSWPWQTNVSKPAARTSKVGQEKRGGGQRCEQAGVGAAHKRLFRMFLQRNVIVHTNHWCMVWCF